MKTAKKYLILFVVLALLGAPLAVALAAYGTPDVVSGWKPDAIHKASVNFRNFGNASGGFQEASLNQLISPESNLILDCPWKSPKKKNQIETNHIHFSYNADALSITINDQGNCSTQISGVSLGNLDYIRIDVVQGSSNNSRIAFNNVIIDGIAEPIGSFPGARNTSSTWSVMNLILNDGFLMEGDIVLTGIQPGGPTPNYIEITVGQYDVFGPTASDVMVDPSPVYLNGSATISAIVDDTGPDGYGLNVTSADFKLDDGSWFPMSASDGIFDSITEAVELFNDFADIPVGIHAACVHGMDLFSNLGDETCQNIWITYMFYGFDDPIDNELMNEAKAGRAIPVKWRLTDANGEPITSENSFAGLHSFPIACGELTEPVETVDEYSAGDSSIQNLGDGYWQFNWKTPKIYAGSCRAMYVEFDSGTISEIVRFQFK